MRLIMFGKQLAEDDARRRLTGDLRGEHEVTVLQRERLSPEDARLERPQRESDHESHRQQAALVQERRDVDQQRDRRNDEEDVRDETEDVVDDAADVCGEDSERRGEDGGDRAGARADQKRAPRPPSDLREDVGSLVGRAEQMMKRRMLTRIEERELGRLARRDEERREQAEQHHAEHDPEPDARFRAAQQEDEPTGHARAARADERCRDRQVQHRLHLGHYAVLTRGSSTRLSRSMMKLATIGQSAKTSRSACVSG